MRLEEAKNLNPKQKRNIAELMKLAESSTITIQLSEDQTELAYYGKSGRLICTEPVSDFDY